MRTQDVIDNPPIIRTATAGAEECPSCFTTGWATRVVFNVQGEVETASSFPCPWRCPPR